MDLLHIASGQFLEPVDCLDSCIALSVEYNRGNRLYTQLLACLQVSFQALSGNPQLADIFINWESNEDS